jgi:hypothetical protein
MKSLFSFYLLIVTPLAALVLAAKWQYLSNEWFFALLVGYCLFWHPLICAIRLVSHHKISRSLFWRNFIPLWNMKYFGFLFFNGMINEKPPSSTE